MKKDDNNEVHISLNTDNTSEIQINEHIRVPKEHVTLHESSFNVDVGGVDYSVLVDLKNLQGENTPYFNATEIVKQYNEAQKYNLFGNPKRLVKWQRSKRFKEITKNIKNAFVIRRGGKGNIAWVHGDIFYSFLFWVDVKYQIEFSKRYTGLFLPFCEVDLIDDKFGYKHLFSTLKDILTPTPREILINKIKDETVGVYYLYLDGVLMYIGQSQNIKSRIKAHKNKEFDAVYYIECSKDDLLKFEKQEIQSKKPKLNIIHNDNGACVWVEPVGGDI